ncbi:MAG: hypothetical protein K6F92_04190 [Lachnospiraceae bacterium]|nr:hypothetical protein [Lachnospiraceae bacterium]
MDKVRIAVATSDGVIVDKHFGKAETFYILEADDADVCEIEIRHVKAACEMGEHDDNRIRENLGRLSDCDCLIASRIGYAAGNVADSLGIKVFELPGDIVKAVDTVIKYIKIQNLFS